VSPVDGAALVAEARAARERAYAPYSRFRVGAALLCADGTVFRGCNVENVSYGLCNCAERVAVGAAVTAGHTDFVAVAIATGSPQGASPCGACRQVLYEFAPDLEVILQGGEGEFETLRLRDLLPRGFGPSDLAPGVDS
jgi:cytidine deaminase